MYTVQLLYGENGFSAVSIYEVDGLILSGDLTGKVLVPLILQDDGSYKGSYFGTTWILKNDKEVEVFRNQAF